MACIPLQSDIIYGPILSRRLGWSLGIDVLATDHKTCSFDCVYCQYGRTAGTHSFTQSCWFTQVSEVLEAVEKALKKPRMIDFRTFSGNGEPSLHPQIPEIVQRINILKDNIRPNVK